MKKFNLHIRSILEFIGRMTLFCSLWLLYRRNPLIENISYGVALFIGSSLILYITRLYLKQIKQKQDH